MKFLTVLLTLLLLAGCTQPSEYQYLQTPDPTPDDIELIGTWSRANGDTWDFYADGDFRYYNGSIEYNTGWYTADPVAGAIYIEDPVAGVSQTYLYEIIGGIILRWAPESAPGNLVDWDRQ